MIALYMRLSRADGDLEGEGAVSNSIANQRAILRSFVERDPGLSCQPVEEFVDDGFSGSSSSACSPCARRGASPA